MLAEFRDRDKVSNTRLCAAMDSGSPILLGEWTAWWRWPSRGQSRQIVGAEWCRGTHCVHTAVLTDYQSV
jgi:hypothetical protein